MLLSAANRLFFIDINTSCDIHYEIIDAFIKNNYDKNAQTNDMYIAFNTNTQNISNIYFIHTQLPNYDKINSPIMVYSNYLQSLNTPCKQLMTDKLTNIYNDVLSLNIAHFNLATRQNIDEEIKILNNNAHDPNGLFGFDDTIKHQFNKNIFRNLIAESVILNKFEHEFYIFVYDGIVAILSCVNFYKFLSIYKMNYIMEQMQNKINALEARCNKLEEENTMLREMIVKYDEELTEWKKLCVNLRDANEGLYKENEKLKEENKKLHEENKEIKDLLYKLYLENEKVREENKKVREENKKVCEENKKVHEENKKLQESCDRLRSYNEIVTKRLAVIENELKELKANR